MRFEVRDKFYLDGEPFQIVSGSFHYFRTVPEYWRDRLEKLKGMGCNTVETYIPWNFHEPKKGCFIWDGMHDVCRFTELAQELGLYVIIRPSPYICAEWEFGGLPSWLLADRNMRLRCSYKPYLDAVADYYKVLIPKLVPYQIDNDGGIILMQIENEYGYYGGDIAYLEFLRDTMRGLGVTVPFITSDGPWSESAFLSGTVNGALPTGNFGSSGEWQFGVMKRLIGDNKPLMCTEFWCGWFDAWGEEHHESDIEKNKTDLEFLLKNGNVNFYMFEGGTNFGFHNGRNQGTRYGDVTSYDYDSPLTEDGRITEKYKIFRDIIGKYREIPNVEFSTEIKRKEYGKLPLAGKTGLFEVTDSLARPIYSPYPLTMEDIGQDTGYILYRVSPRADEPINEITLEGAADRVQCFIDGKHIFTAENESLSEKHTVSDVFIGKTVELLTENIGRVNFGGGLEEQRKGIDKGVRINDVRRFGYEIYSLALDEKQLESLDFSRGYTKGLPAFYLFETDIEELGDTFLDTAGFSKGCAFVNGFNIGRFWDKGPQKRLYIPAPLLKKGKNRIIIFETEGKAADGIYLYGEPLLK